MRETERGLKNVNIEVNGKGNNEEWKEDVEEGKERWKDVNEGRQKKVL